MKAWPSIFGTVVGTAREWDWSADGLRRLGKHGASGVNRLLHIHVIEGRSERAPNARLRTAMGECYWARQRAQSCFSWAFFECLKC